MSTSKDSSSGKRSNIKGSRNCTPENAGDIDSSTMKRAAEQRIKSYFQQLTKGCGVTECDNEYCASSGKMKLMANNDAAVLALQLFKSKAKLCDPLQPKPKGLITVENHKVKEVPHLTEKSLLEIVDLCKGEGSFKQLVHTIGEVFSIPESLNRSFLLNSSSLEYGSLTNVDIEAVRRVYSILFALGDSSVENSLLNSLVALATVLEMDLKFKTPADNQTFLNQFVVVMENTMLQSPEYLERALPCLCKALSLLPQKSQTQLVKIWATFTSEELRQMVETLQQLVTYQVLTGPAASQLSVHDDEVIICAVKCMRLFFCASVLGGEIDADVVDGHSAAAAANGNLPEDPLFKELKMNPINCRQPKIQYEEFVNEALNDQIEMDRDFTNYKSENVEKFSFLSCNFILTTATKSLGLFYDNRVRMYSERRLTLLFSLVRGQQPTPYLRLKVRRDHLIEDALVSLEMVAQDNPVDLKKQLYVEFEGEQGIDEGGVSKEFFQLVVEQIFNPDYGMFTYDEKTRMCWFNPTSFETDAQFVLIGLVLGLAIYNNIILDVYFPMVVYRKLFGKKGTFADLRDSHPDLAQSLQNMLDYTGDVETDFLCHFSFGYTDVFGANLTHVLKENGDNIPVTNNNREEYVNLYTDFILNKSVEKQFSAFRRGFDMVVDESPLKTFFRPDEVELLVCGSKDFDFDALEKATEYDGGLTKESQLIKWFWEVVHSFTMDQKKQLLMFTTGSDRIPVGGLAKLKLIIAKNGPDSDRLPTAHTCFNVLLLPDYSLKEKLQERLLKAITHAKRMDITSMSAPTPSDQQ